MIDYQSVKGYIMFLLPVGCITWASHTGFYMGTKCKLVWRKKEILQFTSLFPLVDWTMD